MNTYLERRNSTTSHIVYVVMLLMMVSEVLYAQKSLVQIKAFDQQLKPMRNIELSINGKEYIQIGSKGDAFVELDDTEPQLKTIKIKDEEFEAASWNYSKGVVEVIIRKKNYHLVKFTVKDQFNNPLAFAKVTFKGINTYTSTTNRQGNFEMALPLEEKVTASSQFSINDHNVTNLSQQNGEFVLKSEKVNVQEDATAPVVTKTTDIKPQEYFKDFDLSKLDSIQSLTVFYAVFKNVQMKNLSEAAKRRVDEKFHELRTQLENSANLGETNFIGRISDSSLVADDIKNLLQQATMESRTLTMQREDFDEKIKLISEKLSMGIENLDETTRARLLSDLELLEGLLKDNENRFYRNLNDYRQLINSLKQKYFDFEDLENKLSESEAQRLAEQKEFRRKLLISLSVAIVFGIMTIMLIYLANKLKKQKKQLEVANGEINRINENLEQLVYERTRELEEAHRELDTFLYRASHDLRSPVCSIIGLCNLASHFSKSEEAKDILDKVVSTTTIMDRLLKKLAIISEINAPTNYSPVVVSDLVENVVDRTNNIVKENKISLNIDCPADLVIQSYPNLIETILTNLVDNALYYTTLKESNEKQVAVNVATRNDKVVITVYDNGIGVEDKIREKVFNMFFKGSVHSKGNGLGLYIVQKSVQALDGTIALESVSGQFSKFIVTLPLQTSHHPEKVNKEREVDIYALN